MELCGVLLEAAIAQLLMVEAVLDDVEGMLDHSAHLRERPLNPLRQFPQGLRQRLDDAALDCNVPRHVAVLKLGPLVRPGVAGITEDVFPRIPQMDWADRTEGRGNAGETAGSFFHPPGPSEFGYLIQRKLLI